MVTKRTAIAAFIIILVLGSIFTGCNSSTTETTGNTTATAAKTWYQQVANDFKALQPSNPPDSLWPVDGKKIGTEFDINTYFSVLTHLSMQQGYVLDYIYLSDGTAGGPIVYVRQADATPFTAYNEYKEESLQNPRAKNDSSLIWLVKAAGSTVFGNKISIDGTKEGYFEYALLQTIGNKFYLWGYTKISDTQIVCEKSQVDNILKELESSVPKASATSFNDFKKAAGKIELTPKIDITENTVTVALTTFSLYDGFTRVTMTILRNYPNTITEQTQELLMDTSGQ